MVTAILSPHLDDAVLSCWHLLEHPGDAVVINVFAGVPSSTRATAWWDELTGARDSGQRVHERVEEDRAALALAARKPVNLGFLDEQYRDAAQPLCRSSRKSRASLSAACTFTPRPRSALTQTTLSCGRSRSSCGRGVSSCLYADLPHATLHGWPASVTRTDAPTSFDLAEALWDRTLAQTGVSPATMHRVVRELDPDSHARKLEAVHT